MQLLNLKKGQVASGKRDRIAIIVEILTKTRNGVNKTRILHSCNLNFKRLELYINFLLGENLLAKEVDEKGQEIYVTTKKGNGVIKAYYELLILLDM